MTRLIPPVLYGSDLPIAVLSAARLDGLLWGVHEGYCAVDEPDRPELRALALAPAVNEHDIVVGRTAAWVHGAGTAVIGALELRPRTRPLGAWRAGVRYREISVHASEVMRFGKSSPLVTTRSRTISDIAIDVHRTVHDIDLVLSLCDNDPDVVRACANDLAAARRRPGKTGGLEFFARVISAAERGQQRPEAA
ncbi:hypothetical protein [Paramicrobacterium agarici]|uniref:hypothetical protein n=1 Tax=Paramicrobacterium agarici TaxID=630514 RepID=UPI001150614C|nr:hypothetical protein [Microbacterium agarici]TQO24400.1 hypothetical protein FB385_3289 [Microbacterium agarici]